MITLLDDQLVVQRVLDHIDKQTTDLGDQVWREPVENYLSHERFAAEMELLRRYLIPLCPAAALPENGSYIARDAAGTSILAVRGSDGVVRAFRNACRHRGMQLADKSGCQKGKLTNSPLLDGGKRHGCCNSVASGSFQEGPSSNAASCRSCPGVSPWTSWEFAAPR